MKNINKLTIIISISTLIAGIGLGWFFFSGEPSKEHNHEIIGEAKNQIWTCSMHPSVRQNEPGKCPLCGMDLFPLETSTGDDNPMEVKMSPAAMKLANIQTSVISKQKPKKVIRLNGKVQPNEHYVYSQTSHISGRVEKLLVSFTGEYVKKGQEIAHVYSPELVTTQEELFEAFKIKETQPALYEASREKLKNWKLTDKQIDGIIQAGKPREQFPILADISGVVITKNVTLGDYIKQGSSLFEIADLSRLWILFDIYESDMSWVQVGDEVEYNIQSLPGETFKSKISFIDPIINSKTRVAKARISVRNQGSKLKPEMFVTGLIKSPVQDGEKTIIVPKSAVMWTGKRSVVYVKTNSDVGVSFMMRMVTLGPSLGESYIIENGLEEGEEIAVYGTFSIDAAAQLAGKPSMMNPRGGAVMTGHNHGMTTGKNDNVLKSEVKALVISLGVKQALSPLYESYLTLKDALVNDDFKQAKEEAVKLMDQMKSIKMSIFKGETHNIWMRHSIPAEKAINELVNASDIAGERKPFKPLSNHMIQLAKAFNPFEKPLYILHCTMADDLNGADWLSTEENIMNPYFGQSMLTCGDVKEKIN